MRNVCNFRPRTFAQAEAGCPLDHALCGAHIVEGDKHEDGCEECKEMRRDWELSHVESDEIEF